METRRPAKKRKHIEQQSENAYLHVLPVETRTHAKKRTRIEQPEDAYLHALPNEVLYDEIRPHLRPKDKFYLSRECANFHALFQIDLDKLALLRAVVDDKKEIVKKILDTRPELLLEEPRNLVIESKFTWQKFCAKKALKMALMRHQVGMVELILPYFKVLEERGDIEEGRKEALRQWDEVDVAISKQEENLDDFIQPLITMISKETFPNGSEGDRLIDRISEETKASLSAFIKTILPDEAITLDNYVDVEKLLIATYKAYYDARFNTFQNWNQRDLFCIGVIGFLQSVQNPELAKAFCESLYYVVEEKRPISARAESLKLFDNKTSFYRSSRDAHSGVGSDWLIGRWGSGGCGGKTTGVYLETYVEEKQACLARLKASLSQDVGLDMSP
jgi:hypothetical protein